MAVGGTHKTDGRPGSGIGGKKRALKALQPGNRIPDSDLFVTRTDSAVLHWHSHLLSYRHCHLPCYYIPNKITPYRCISYLMLCNKSPQHLQLKVTNNHPSLLVHAGQEFGKGSAGFLFQVSQSAVAVLCQLGCHHLKS